MVRGVSRRVIVVKPEQPELFEQAIFLVRDYNAPRGDMVREACRIANSYLPRRRRREKRRTVFLCWPDSAQAHCSSALYGR